MRQFFIFLALFSTLAITNACKKSGCLVPYADNFNVDAKIDSKQCSYTGTRVFWMSKKTSDSLTKLVDTSSIFFYMDDKPMNEMSTLNYSPTVPACNDAKAMTLTTPLSDKEEDFRNIKIYNQYSTLIFEADVRFSASVCNNTEIKLFN